MKKITFTFIAAFISSILVSVFFYKNTSMMVNALFFIILITMLTCDVIAKKTMKELLFEALMIGVAAYFVLSMNNDVTNPYSLIPALLCMIISTYRTFKLIG